MTKLICWSILFLFTINACAGPQAPVSLCAKEEVKESVSVEKDDDLKMFYVHMEAIIETIEQGVQSLPANDRAFINVIRETIASGQVDVLKILLEGATKENSEITDLKQRVFWSSTVLLAGGYLNYKGCMERIKYKLYIFDSLRLEYRRAFLLADYYLLTRYVKRYQCVDLEAVDPGQKKESTDEKIKNDKTMYIEKDK